MRERGGGRERGGERERDAEGGGGVLNIKAFSYVLFSKFSWDVTVSPQRKKTKAKLHATIWEHRQIVTEKRWLMLLCNSLPRFPQGKEEEKLLPSSVWQNPLSQVKRVGAFSACSLTLQTQQEPARGLPLPPQKKKKITDNTAIPIATCTRIN